MKYYLIIEITDGQTWQDLTSLPTTRKFEPTKEQRSQIAQLKYECGLAGLVARIRKEKVK